MAEKAGLTQKNIETVNEFQKEMETKALLAKSIQELDAQQKSIKGVIRQLQAEYNEKDKQFRQILAEIGYQSNTLANIERQIAQKSKEALDRIAEKEKTLDTHVAEYQKARNEYEALLKEQRRLTEELKTKSQKLTEDSDRLKAWVETATQSINDREKAYAESQKAVTDDVKKLKAAKEAAEAAEKALAAKKAEYAKTDKEYALQKEALDKQREALEAKRQKDEDDYKAAMEKVVTLKASVEAEKRDLKDQADAVREERLRVTALEKRVNDLIKRYNLEKEAKG